jgi:hypothetical protein
MPERRIPTVPPPGQRVRVVIDTDAANEVDDQYAIALALLSPERLDLRGFVAAHWGDSGGPQGIERSYEEVVRVMELAGMASSVPVLHGSHPLRYNREPSHSEGVEFILSEARRATPDDPLWLVFLGPMTDGVSAYLLDPTIADRVVVVFHSRSRWPEKFYNGNVFSDIRAARALLEVTTLPTILFDTGTYLRLPMDEAERTIAPHGALGHYLVDIRRRRERWMQPEKALYDLGDIAFLVDPALAEWEQVAVPSITRDLLYDHTTTHGRMLRVYHIDRPGTYRLLSQRLAGLADAARP